LLHFNVPNHGKLWKSLMKAYLGDYEKMELKLKEIVLSEKLSSSSGRDRKYSEKKTDTLKHSRVGRTFQ